MDREYLELGVRSVTGEGRWQGSLHEPWVALTPPGRGAWWGVAQVTWEGGAHVESWLEG